MWTPLDTRCLAGRFLKSETVREFVGFISAMSEAAKGAKVSDECPVTEPVAGLLSALRQLSAWVDDIPPLRQAMRYGNPAYRQDSPSAPRSTCPCQPACHMLACEYPDTCLVSCGALPAITSGHLPKAVHVRVHCCHLPFPCTAQGFLARRPWHVACVPEWLQSWVLLPHRSS